MTQRPPSRARRVRRPSGPCAEDGLTFVEWLHGPEREHVPPFVAYLLAWPKGLMKQYFHYPGSLPYRLDSCGLGVYMSVCLFRTDRRREREVAEIPACWVDLDPPKDLKRPEYLEWLLGQRDRLVGFRYPPSAIVFSGRGLHAYWKFKEPIYRYDYEESAWKLVAERVKRTNRALRDALNGDAAFDLARVLRVPGSLNRKTGERCGVVSYSKVRYDPFDLSEKLGVDLSDMERKPRVAPAPVVIPQRRPRQVEGKRGRPPLLARAHDLRRLPPWVRRLVKGGVWAMGARFRKAGGLDRSRGDLAAVGALLRAGWSEGQIFAAFERTDWLVGDKFREIVQTRGEVRAEEYLARTIERARSGLWHSVADDDRVAQEDHVGRVPEADSHPATDSPDASISPRDPYCLCADTPLEN